MLNVINFQENSRGEKSLGESTHSKSSKGSSGSSKEQSLKKTEEWLNGTATTQTSYSQGSF